MNENERICEELGLSEKAVEAIKELNCFYLKYGRSQLKTLNLLLESDILDSFLSHVGYFMDCYVPAGKSHIENGVRISTELLEQSEINCIRDLLKILKEEKKGYKMKNIYDLIIDTQGNVNAFSVGTLDRFSKCETITVEGEKAFYRIDRRSYDGLSVYKERIDKFLKLNGASVPSVRRFYVETNAYNTVVFTDGTNACAINDSVNDVSTIEKAAELDYSGIDGCETVEEIAEIINAEVFPWNAEEFDRCIPF